MSKILCLNSGSSSLKFSLFDVEETAKQLAQGAVENIAAEEGNLWIHGPAGRLPLALTGHFSNHLAAVHAVFEALDERQLPPPDAVGHRIVHGGLDYVEPAIVDKAMLKRLRELIPYAPLHLPSEIATIEAVTKRYAQLPQVATFDTSFHRHLPFVSKCFPLPRRFCKDGLHRYGFHGLSFESILFQLGPDLPRRLIIAHLGNGVSLSAILEGEEIDTTMGFTPTGGTMMGTRCGDLDPGVLIYLLRERRYDAEGLEHLLNVESGLLGVSGISSDMKVLLDSAEGAAKEAISMFCYRVRKEIGAFAAALGGLDCLVFTAGIGERSAKIRQEICCGLTYLGIQFDQVANAAHQERITLKRSPCDVRVMHTDEDLMIARHTKEKLS